MCEKITCWSCIDGTEGFHPMATFKKRQAKISQTIFKVYRILDSRYIKILK